MNETQLRWIKDMADANLLIHKADALVYDDEDGWVGIDPTLLHEGFVQYYADLTSIGYANGWIR